MNKHQIFIRCCLSWLIAAGCFAVPDKLLARSPRGSIRRSISHPVAVVPSNAYYSGTFPSQGVSALPPTQSFREINGWNRINNQNDIQTVSKREAASRGRLSPEVLQTIRELKEQKERGNAYLPQSPMYSAPSPINGIYNEGLIMPTASDNNPYLNANSKTKKKQEYSAFNEDTTYFKLPSGKNIYISSLDFREAPIADVLRSLSQIVNVNLMLDSNIKGQVTVMFTEVSIEEAFNTLLSSFKLGFEWNGSILHIFNLANAPIVTKIFTLKHTNVADVEPAINELLTPGKGTCKPDIRTNSIIINDTAEKIKEIKGLLPALDMKESSVEVSSRPITEVFYLNYAGAESLAAPIQMLAPNVKIQNYSSTQASQAAAAGEGGSSGRQDMMIITDTQNNLNRIRELIEKLDVPPIQVTIDAHIYEIDKNKEEQLGVNWQKAIPVDGSSDNLLNINISPTSADAGGTGVFRFGSINSNQFTALLSMLNTSSFAKVLSNPVITTLNNSKATISVGQSISYVSSTTTMENGTVEANVSQAQANITLDVTPSVTGNNEVFLDINPDIKSILGYTTLNGNSTPNMSTRSAKTQVICKSNHTIVIGGMIKTDTNESINKVPFFGNLPGIGKLFQSKTKNETRSELIIFITPRIIRTAPISDQNEFTQPPRLTFAD